MYIAVFAYSFFATAFFLVSLRSAPHLYALTALVAALPPLDGPPGRISHGDTRQPRTALAPCHLPLPGRGHADRIHGGARSGVVHIICIMHFHLPAVLLAAYASM